MKKSVFCFLFAGLLSGFTLNAQEFFVKGKDTTYARDIEYTVNVQGFVTNLTYTDKTGKKIEIDGKKKLKDLVSIHYYNGVVERMPLKTSKPDGYVRYGGRVLDGKLKVLLYDDQHETTTWVKNPINRKMDGFKTSTSGTRLFYLKMPDGTFHNLSKKSVIKNDVKPYLLQCQEFKRQYKGDYSADPALVVEMIRLYNNVCR